MNAERFMEARIRAISESGEKDGFGRLAEKTLHKTLKYYVEPDESFHEIKFLGSIADIKNESGIYEIQTRAAYKLRAKILKYMAECHVCLVLPLAAKKTVSWVDRESGEISPPRKSPKSEGVYDALFEMSTYYDILDDPAFSVRLIYLDTTEYRHRGKGGSAYGSRRIERMANSILDECDINEKESLIPLISDIPKTEFTAKEFSKITKRSGRRQFYIMKLLENLHLIERVGKRGNAFVYKRCF